MLIAGQLFKGEYARTLSLTDVFTGWVHLEVCRNNARKHIIAGLDRATRFILSRWNPLFAWLPVETLVKERQKEYYNVLANSDEKGDSTHFI